MKTSTLCFIWAGVCAVAIVATCWLGAYLSARWSGACFAQVFVLMAAVGALGFAGALASEDGR